jgi:hypothetical protein
MCPCGSSTGASASVRAALRPFDAWMFTPSPSYLWPVEVVLGDGAARTTAKVINVANPVANVGFQTLIVAGHHQTAQGAPGKWYWIGGIGAERDACQSGEWDAAADQDSSGNFTEFTLPSEAYVSDWQVGWLLQPDINVPVYLPITSINAGSLTVSGSYGSLAPSSPKGGLPRGAALFNRRLQVDSSEEQICADGMNGQQKSFAR